jgi:arginase family enzyme
MEIAMFFEPVDQAPVTIDEHHKRLGDIIRVHTREGGFPELDGVHIAILGVREDRRSVDNEGCAFAPEQVRQQLYRLFPFQEALSVADLGDIRKGYSVEDTYFALASAVSQLIREGILPVIIGGSQDLTYANYMAYEQLGQIINIVAVDPRFDLGRTETELDAASYLSRIILHQPNYLFNYTNIGYQSYYVDHKAVNLMKNLLFDAYRLGRVRANLEEVEPMVRNADMISVDISAVRQSDAPGHKNASPNGFNGEELCQIVRYAGMSDKLTSIGFYEYNPTYDPFGQTAQLIAQMIWYFIDGFYSRAKDFPIKNKEDYLKYTVAIRNHQDEIVFYKSKRTDRWWMEVTCPASVRSKYYRHYLVPCSYADYQIACSDDVPDRWWQVYQKFM